ncbi:MAG: NlpC/P60 family protein [Chitinophagaceae bacterium]|nr:MAG: NlpC/P60 family protein [Chitinophagaceae bacterium]
MRKLFPFLTILFAACGAPLGPDPGWTTTADTLEHIDSLQAYDSHRVDGTLQRDTAVVAVPDSIESKPGSVINTRNVRPADVVAFAKTLTGTPYVYASSNPKVGFDCSGFITYVFNHFGISVPRSSVDFTSQGQTVPPAEARPGDLILFTGTHPGERTVGHMGIVIEPSGDTLRFIHSTSGKAMGVTVSPLTGYYEKRFVRVARVFP